MNIAPSICTHCDTLDDPAQNWPCPCRAWRESRPRPTPRQVPTLAERRAAYSSLPVLDVTAAAAEQDDERKDGAA